MAYVSGVIHYTPNVPGKGPIKIKIMPEPHTELEIKLLSDLTYDIALDQSSSCTGIAIFSTDNSVKILLEVARDTGTRDTFYRDLKSFLYSLIKGHNIRLVISEDPPPVKGQMYTSRMLLELKGRISEWFEDFPELENAEKAVIFPQSWKSLVMDKSKGTGRSSKKKCIADDICDIYPMFREYFNYGLNKDYDGFDAVGILTGYRRYAFTEEGLPLICGQQEKRHTSFVWYRYVPVETLQNKEKLNEIFGLSYIQVKPEFKLYNSRYNKHQNIRMASSNAKTCIYTMLDDKQFDVIKWKYDLEQEPNHVLLMYVMNASKTPVSLINLLKAMFPMNEEVVEI